MIVTEEMVDRALAVDVDLIQGFTHPERIGLHHVIRDFRTEYTRGVEIWAGSNHAAMMKMLTKLKMAAQLNAALSDPATGWHSSLTHADRKPTDA